MVVRRFRHGGHTNTENVIRRRFKVYLENFHKRYGKVVDWWEFYGS
jgi:hypothetical protein